MQKLASPAQAVTEIRDLLAYASSPKPSRAKLSAMVLKLYEKVGTVRTASKYGKPLYGHHDMASAYMVDDYPYGRKLRCRIRYWLESDPRKGFRFVSQTEDPRNGRWNNPKKSTYMTFAGAMYLDSQDHVHWTGLSEYSDAPEALEFVKEFPGADYRLLKPFVAAKIRFLQKRADGTAVFTVNGVPQPISEDDIGRARKEIEIWEDVLRAI